jgi:hypothetical protein
MDYYITALWDVTPCDLVDRYKTVRRHIPEDYVILIVNLKSHDHIYWHSKAEHYLSAHSTTVSFSIVEYFR